MFSRSLFLFMLAFILAVVACSPVSSNPAVMSATPPVIAVTPVILTAITGSLAPGTIEPFSLTRLPPDYTPSPTVIRPIQTPIPATAGGLGPTWLKYRLLAQFPDLFFCDPDYYPVARMDEAELARERFPEIQANPEEFEAILAQLNLAGLSSFSDEQKLQIYQEYKKLAAIRMTQVAGGYEFQLQSAKTEGAGEWISGLINSQGVISVEQRQPTIATCPICLAKGTLIDTPVGPLRVEDLRPGMRVWTLDRRNLRIVADLLEVSQHNVSLRHQVIHLVLDDGRELWASPGHPTADGRVLGQLKPGEMMDGAKVILVEQIPYIGEATYDLFPAGGTGYYWANGILIASTLTKGNPR